MGSTKGYCVLLCATLALLASFSRAHAIGRIPADRLTLLAHGINLNAWFTPWASPIRYATAFGPSEADFLKRTGFTVCRLPLAPDFLFDPRNPGTPRPEIRYVDRAVRLLLDAGLAVVVDPIHGSSSNADWETRLDHDPSFLTAVESYWQALAQHYAAFSADRIFFEVMNEPHLSAREKVDSGWWQPVQESLVRAIRQGAPSNTIIVTGERWGGIDGLRELKPLADPNVVYSFHWYDPMTFTHQGAAWAGAAQAELGGIPYPSSPAAVESAATSLQDTRARTQVLRYGNESWDAARIQTGLRRAADWAAENHVALFCGEFGVYRRVAPAADRLRWIGDVRRALESLGIGWSMWDYETDFGLVTYDEPDWRRGVHVDSDCLSALGLDASQRLLAGSRQPTVADFAGRRAASLEIPVDAWSNLWTRDPGAGTVLAEEDSNGVPIALTVTHAGSRDWALSSGLRIPVTSGERLRLSSRASREGSGSASLQLVARDDSGKVLDWSFAEAPVVAGPTAEVASDFFVSGGVATIEPRWSGTGPARVHVEAFLLERRSGHAAVPHDPASLRNNAIQLDFDPVTTAFAVRDLRAGYVWSQLPAPDWSTGALDVAGRHLNALLVERHTGRGVRVALDLDPSAAEVEVSVDADGVMPRDLRYPLPFAPAAGSRLVVPLNEGIMYPVDDPSEPEARLVAYGGHGICMSFWGVDTSRPGADAGPASMAILETPDDASLELKRINGLLAGAPVWEAQKGEFGYTRKIRYVFFDSGGPVAMAARYRRYVQERGSLVTLASKRERNSNVDLLMGAADIWYWDRDPAAMAGQLKSNGMDRVLWSAGENPSVIEAINAIGFLSGRYDIYQDVMEPAQFPRLRGVQAEWPTEAWPEGLVRDKAGNWIHGWEVVAKDGTRIPCGVLSDARAVTYAEERISQDLETHPYRARFIDTTTASPWREDWDPTHPLTRTQSREWRMRLLDLVSGEKRLVTGSETGHDAAVPFVHYFEGMMSLGPFRIPDAGRDMQRILADAPESLIRFQLGWKYRIPLWELVYHDCVVAYWYWGDYSNKIPRVWGIRDLFNALYGTPPVYMFDSAFWKANRERFATSYRVATATARATAYAAMTDFRFLSADAAVQRSSFSNGAQVTVNFGNAPWRMEDGTVLPAGGVLLRHGPGG